MKRDQTEQRDVFSVWTWMYQQSLCPICAVESRAWWAWEAQGKDHCEQSPERTYRQYLFCHRAQQELLSNVWKQARWPSTVFIWFCMVQCWQLALLSTSANSEFPLLLGSWACCKTWSNWIWRSRFVSRDFCGEIQRCKQFVEKTTECAVWSTNYPPTFFSTRWLSSSLLISIMNLCRRLINNLKGKRQKREMFLTSLDQQKWQTLFKHLCLHHEQAAIKSKDLTRLTITLHIRHRTRVEW